MVHQLVTGFGRNPIRSHYLRISLSCRSLAFDLANNIAADLADKATSICERRVDCSVDNVVVGYTSVDDNGRIPARRFGRMNEYIAKQDAWEPCTPVPFYSASSDSLRPVPILVGQFQFSSASSDSRRPVPIIFGQLCRRRSY